MQPEHKNPKVRLFLGIATVAGVGLMAAQLWNAGEFGGRPAAQEPGAMGHSPRSDGARADAGRAALRSGMLKGTFESEDGEVPAASASTSVAPTASSAADGAPLKSGPHGRSAYDRGRTGAWDQEILPQAEDPYRQGSGQQGGVTIPLRADPGIQYLSRGEAEPDQDLAALPSANLEAAYRKLGSAAEREQFLAELTATNRDNLPQILDALFRAESDPALKESILAAASDAGGESQFRGMLLSALDAGQTVDVRLAALYYASDHAPELVKQYVNDANVDVREEARNLADVQSNP